jgi:hypothetical protein
LAAKSLVVIAILMLEILPYSVKQVLCITIILKMQKQYQIAYRVAGSAQMVFLIKISMYIQCIIVTDSRRLKGKREIVAVRKTVSVERNALLIINGHSFQFLAQGLAINFQNFGCLRFVASHTGQHILDVLIFHSSQ